MPSTSTPNRRQTQPRGSARMAHSMSPAIRMRNSSLPAASNSFRPVMTATFNETNSARRAPRAVTPTSSTSYGTARSWEDFDEGVFGAQRKMFRERGLTTSQSFTSRSSSRQGVVRHDDMPMDELMDTSAASRMGDGTSSGISRIVSALEGNSTGRPSHLTTQERILWDLIQKTLYTTRQQHKDREVELERRLIDAKRLVSPVNTPLQEQLRELQELMKVKESEHDAEVRAIQRVLAEMTAEREAETEVLKAKLEALEKGGSAAESGDSASMAGQIAELQASLKSQVAEKTTLKREADKKARRLLVLERDYKVTKVQLKKAEERRKAPPQEVAALQKKFETSQQNMAALREQNEKLQLELETLQKQRMAHKRVASTPPRPEGPTTDSESVSSALSTEEVESLQKNLTETSSSLENAKKIIASLENANGSLAIDLRSKLKAKEEELSAVQSESADRKRRLDSLATELRDIQRVAGDTERANKMNKAEVIRQKALLVQLEKSISGLQSASVVHEISSSTGQPDAPNIDQIAEILSDTMMALKATVEKVGVYVNEFDDQSESLTEADVSSEVGRHIDSLIRNDREAAAQDLRNELDLKKNAIRRLEDALTKQNDEMKRLRGELGARTPGNTEVGALRAQVQSLRTQCSTNMEVLAKKERELSVLRASLKVDENDAGYISDDASDADDDETDTVMSAANLNGYGPAEAEALATLMAAGSGVSDRSHEVDTLKNELLRSMDEKEKAMKDLQTERESLANAKMIISSLEKANKSMMEDLRSRLQDSNTAIASLLDKSTEHEKNSKTLREELDQLKKSKEEEGRIHEAEVKKLKEEAKVHSLRIAAKDRELTDMRKQVSGSSEEKKDDAGNTD